MTARILRERLEMSRVLIFAMAVCTGIAAANLYYNQPMLNVISQEMPGAAQLIAPVTQFGYAIGLFLLVPLGDIVERRRLIVIQFLVLAGALMALAVAPEIVTVVAASALIGIASTAAQQIIPFGAHLAPAHKRGAVVGSLMSGLLCGILLSRVISGYVGSVLGWRGMYMLAVPIALGAAALMAWILPRSRPAMRMPYTRLLLSLGELWRTMPQLRQAAITQGLLFAGFTAFWTVLPFRLAEPQFGYGAMVAGLFGLFGLVSIAAAPVSGRMTDARGAVLVVRIGCAVVLAAWLLLAAFGTMSALMGGLILLNFGQPFVLVANQHTIYAIREEARGRVNTVLMGSMFFGGGAGSAAGIAAWNHAGWEAVMLLFSAISFIAMMLQFLPRKAAA